jgi:hypothetical protein
MNAESTSTGYGPGFEPDTRARESAFVEVPKETLLLFFGVAGLGLLSGAPLLTALVLLLPLLFMLLLWRRDEPPVLPFICAMQWLQVASDLLYVNTYAADFTMARDNAANTQATWLSAIGLLVLALGMRWGITGMPSAASREATGRQRVEQIPLGRLFLTYLVAFVISFVAGRVLFLVPGLSTIFAGVACLKFVFFFMLAYVVWRRRAGWVFLGMATLLELGIGVSGFFSSFKTPLFLLAMVLLVSQHRLTRRLAFGGGVLFAVLAFVMVIWSAVKTPYREFLNQGSGLQLELVPVSERYAKLAELTSQVGREALDYGFQTMMQRVAYTTYFAQALQHVPEVVPHEHGALWWGNLLHILQPRMFFPNKPVLEDSELTMKYTGEIVAGLEQGTSVSMGYMTECYVDFGEVGMFVPIFLIGLALGLIYRFFLRRTAFPLLGMGVLAGAFAIQFYQLEMSGMKLFGSMVSTFILYAAFVFVFERLLRTWFGAGAPESERELETDGLSASAPESFSAR